MLTDEDPAAGVTDSRAPAPQVHVTATLDIWPREHEHAFWESLTWLESMRNADMWFLAHATCNNLLLQAYISKIDFDFLVHLHHFSAVYLALALLHSGLAARGDATYYRWRTVLLIVQRTIRFVNVLMDISSYRSCASSAPCTAWLLRHMARPGLKPLGAAFRSLLIVTCVGTVLIHTAYLRFSFKLQLAAQLLTAGTVLLLVSVPSTHLLSVDYFRPSIVCICKGINRFSAHAIRGALGIPMQARNVCDSPSATFNVVLFMLAIFGLLVPLAIAYCEERRIKMRYIEDELGVPAWQFGIVWGFVDKAVKVAVLMGIYAACSWALVSQYHVRIVRWMVPLNWPGTNMTWYHVLMADRASAASNLSAGAAGYASGNG